jgi:hypothetical protein
LKLESKAVNGNRIYHIDGEAPPEGGGSRSKRRAV